MTTDLLTRRHAIAIAYPDGSRPIDVSPLVESFVVTNRHLDQSGLIQTTGTLVLKCYPFEPFTERSAELFNQPSAELFPEPPAVRSSKPSAEPFSGLFDEPFSEPFDPLKNRWRWQRGNRITIAVEAEDGSWVLHPRAALNILKQPARPHPGRPYLEIEVGCDLALRDYAKPPDNDTEIPLGQKTDRRTLINRLAAKAHLPNLIEPIPGWEISYPLWRLEGSYVQQMGAIAYAAGYVLWMDGLRRLRAKRIHFNPDQADLCFDALTSGSVFEPLDAAEIPPELIRVSCTTQTVKPVLDPPPQTSVSYSNSLALFGAGSDSDSVIAEVSTLYHRGTGTRTPQVIRVIKQPRGVLMPEQFPNSTHLETSSESTTANYEEGDRGYLVRQVRELSQALGVTQPDRFPGETENRTAQKQIIAYEYAADTTHAITETTLEQQGVVYPSRTGNVNQATLTLSRRQRTVWRQVNQGWQQLTTSQNNRSGGAASSISYSGSGNNQPPAPEVYGGEFYSEEEVLSEEVRLSSQGGAWDDREREFELMAGTAVSAEQLRFIGGLIGRQLHGQEMGITFAVGLSPFLSRYEPLQVVDWVEPPAPDDPTDTPLTSRYVMQGDSFALTADGCVVAADGICLGVVRTHSTTATLEPLVDPPSPLSGAIALIGSLGWLPYAAAADTGSSPLAGGSAAVGSLGQAGLDGAIGIVGSLGEIAGTLRWDGLTAQQWDGLTAAQWDRAR